MDRSALSYLYPWRAARTDGSILGLCSTRHMAASQFVTPTAGPEDAVDMFQGNRIPFVAKSVCGGDFWEYASECYVHGCMNGETRRIDGVEWKFLLCTSSLEIHSP